MDMSKPKILVTKKLIASQKRLLSHFLVFEETFIAISFPEFIELQLPIKNAIFTSKNSVKAIFELYSPDNLHFENVFCVGNKTAKLLEEYKVSISILAHSAEELANQIIANKSISEVHFFCGNIRRDELPEILRESNIVVLETEVYKTSLTPKKIDEKFDGLLFFSPSSIKSYISSGNSTESIAFCIGNTTALEAVNYFENVFMADEPTVEHVIQTANQYFGYE